MKKKLLLALDDAELDKIVHIKGTQFNRRRKLSDKQIVKARKMYEKKKMSIEEIAEFFHVHWKTIKYHLDEEYRQYRLNHANYPKMNTAYFRDYNAVIAERAAYKRELVRRGKIKVK